MSSINGSSSIIKNYEALPSTFFPVSNMPGPLVLKSWMVHLRAALKDEENSKRKEAHPSKPELRKRGRPKKVAPPINKEIESFEKVEEEEMEEEMIPFIDHDSNTDDNESQELTTVEKPALASENHKSSRLFGKYLCSHCPKQFKAESTLKSHLRIHNGNLLQCNECNRGFVTKYLLKCHKRIHTGDLFTCQICGSGFMTTELLKVHTRRHTGEKPFVCDKCPMRFPTSSNLLQHRERHATEKKFLCSHCGASFNLRRSLQCHMLVHSEKTHICKICGKPWARKTDLLEHMRVHTKDRPYECEVCHRKYSQSSSLKRHRRTHQDSSNNCSCPHCPQMFLNDAALQQHALSHNISCFAVARP